MLGFLTAVAWANAALIAFFIVLDVQERIRLHLRQMRRIRKTGWTTKPVTLPIQSAT